MLLCCRVRQQREAVTRQDDNADKVDVDSCLLILLTLAPAGPSLEDSPRRRTNNTPNVYCCRAYHTRPTRVCVCVILFRWNTADLDYHAFGPDASVVDEDEIEDAPVTCASGNRRRRRTISCRQERERGQPTGCVHSVLSCTHRTPLSPNCSCCWIYIGNTRTGARVNNTLQLHDKTMGGTRERAKQYTNSILQNKR